MKIEDIVEQLQDIAGTASYNFDYGLETRVCVGGNIEYIGTINGHNTVDCEQPEGVLVMLMQHAESYAINSVSGFSPI
jgi:hypothetical protein